MAILEVLLEISATILGLETILISYLLTYREQKKYLPDFTKKLIYFSIGSLVITCLGSLCWIIIISQNIILLENYTNSVAIIFSFFFAIGLISMLISIKSIIQHY